MSTDVYGSGIVLRAPTSWDECDEINHKYYKKSLQMAAKKTSVNDQFNDDPLKFTQTYPEKEVQKYNITASLSQNGNVDIESDQFNPHLFLATKHHPLKHKDLDRAKNNLQTTMDDLNMKMILLSERNIHKFAEAKNIVDMLCSNKDAKFRDGSVERLDQALENAIIDAEKLCNPLIQRKEECEEMIQVLTLFKKTKFVLYLPSYIKENIKKEEYKKIVHDYSRYKYFKQKFGHVTLFDSIFSTIEHDITQLVETLLKKLSFSNSDVETMLNTFTKYSNSATNTTTTSMNGISSHGTCNTTDKQQQHHSVNSYKILTESQERIIGYLNNLDCKIDASWHYLEKMHQFIKDSLQKCLNNYERNTRDISELIEQEELFNDDNSTNSTSFFRQLLEKKTVELVSDLTNVLLKTIPDFWQLCQNILIGKYKKKKTKKTKHDLNLESEISNLMKDLTVKYSNIVNTAIETIDNNTAHQKSICQCICEIVKCNEQLEMLKIPKKYISNFGEYTNLMTKYIVNEIWNRTILEISHFHKLENWKTISETLTITELPLKFQEFVIKTLSLLRPFMSKGSIHNEELVNEVEKYLMECIQVFADCFHELSFNAHELSRKQSLGGKYRFSLANFNKIEEKDTRLLLTLSNCSHTKNVIVFNVLSAFVAGFKMHHDNDNELNDKMDGGDDYDQSPFIDDSDDDDSDEDNIQESNASMKTFATGAKKAIAQMELSFHMTSKHLQTQTNDFMKKESVQQVYTVYDTLIDLLINDFVRRKSLTFYKCIEKGLLLSGYDWKVSPPPSSIRSYILDLLLELSMVHSKTEKMTSVTFNNVNLSTDVKTQNNNFTTQNLSVNRAFTSKIFSLLTERLGETFLHFSKSIEDVCENAAFQFDIDISFIRRALQSFETQRTKTIYQRINKHLTKLANFSSSSEHYQILKNTLIASAAEKSFTQLDCFDIHVETSFNLLSISSSFRMMESGHTMDE